VGLYTAGSGRRPKNHLGKRNEKRDGVRTGGTPCLRNDELEEEFQWWRAKHQKSRKQVREKEGGACSKRRICQRPGGITLHVFREILSRYGGEKRNAGGKNESMAGNGAFFLD